MTVLRRRGSVLWWAVTAALGGCALASPAAAAHHGAATGVAVEGRDQARILLPAAASIESYSNFGYSLSVLGGVAEVDVDLAPLESAVPFASPARVDPRDPVARLAASVTAGATTRYEAATRLLDWMARHVRYELDRSKPQGALEVLERRSGYCTGVARLTVALLEAVAIPAREVPGYVAVTENGGPSGYHRWVEIYYGDRGWVFSDPLVAQHYVPANYVRLAGEGLLPEPLRDLGRVLGREDGRRVVDLFLHAPAGVSARRNLPGQLAGALQVELGGAATGVAVLEGAGRRRVREVVEGRGTFVGLEPGTYLLTVLVEGQPARSKRVVFRGRVQGAVYFPVTEESHPLPPRHGDRG